MDLFRDATNELIIGEASATYLSDPDAPRLIHEMSPNSKILISLRDPVERAYSAYLMHWGAGTIKKSFHDELSYELTHDLDLSKPSLRLPAGFCYNEVKRYLELFGKEQTKIIIFEHWVKDPKTTILEILEFLGIQYEFKNFIPEKHNRFYGARGKISDHIIESNKIKKITRSVLPLSIRKFVANRILRTYSKPAMNDKDREILTNYYKEDVEKLKSFLNQDLPWINFKN